MALGLTDRAKIENAMRFIGALRFIETKYVNDVNNNTLMDGAINGMVKSLDDPHSIYMDTKLYKRLTEQTEGSFGGIGVYMGFKGGKVSILSVMDNTPGQRAGLKPNDEIIAVDGTPISQIQPEEDNGFKTKFTPCNEKIAPKEKVNLRNKPSVTDADSVVVVSLEAGQTATRTGINTDVGWSRIEYNGQVLYCVSSYIYVVE